MINSDPIDEYIPYFVEQNIEIFSNLQDRIDKVTSVVSIAGVVSGKQERQSARGNRFAFVQFSDPGGIFETTVFSDVLDRSRDLFDIGEILILLCETKSEGEQIKLLLKSVQPIRTVIEKSDGNGYRVFINSVEAVNALAERLLDKTPKNDVVKVPLNVVVMDSELVGDLEIELPDNYLISPDVIGAIKHIDGVTHVERIES